VSNLREMGSKAVDDRVLLQKVAAGDTQALDTLYQRYARVVFGLGQRMLMSPELAEDLVQETFWRVWRRSKSFNAERGQVAQWIFGIAHNLAIDELRRQRSRPVAVYETEDNPVLGTIEDQRSDVVNTALDQERRRVIGAALERLPQEQREVIELSYFGGFSQSEIADKLNNPVGTIKTRARLGLQKLREALLSQGLQFEDLGS
jgi:RNA polymerase sigma-70 factor, ECF subfamily